MINNYVKLKYVTQYEQNQRWKSSFDSNLRFIFQIKDIEMIIRSAKKFKMIKRINMYANDFTFTISKDSQQIILLTFGCEIVILDYFNVKKRFQLPMRFSRTIKYVDKQSFLTISTYSQIMLYNHKYGEKKVEILDGLDKNHVKLLEISNVNSMIIMIAQKIAIFNMKLNQVFDGIQFFQQDSYYHFVDERNEIIVSDDTYITIYRIDFENKTIIKYKTTLLESQNSNIWQILIAQQLLLIQLQFKNNIRIYKYQKGLKLIYHIKNLPYPSYVGCNCSSGCQILHFGQAQHNNYILFFESLPIGYQNYMNNTKPKKVKLYRLLIKIRD
ncbi:hypothetical protein pb186bvf_020980 [Paramecium bursaria]